MMRYRRDKSYEKFISLIKNGEIKDHYRLIFKNLNAVIYILSNKGLMTYVNSYAEKISHYKINELLGKHFIKIVAPESQTAAVKSFAQQLKGREIKPYELAVIDKNNEKIYLRTSESIIRHDGKIIGVLGIATDITEHKRNAEDLHKMVKELRLLYDIGTELVSIMDIDLLFQKILSHLRNTFGYERNSILLIDDTTNELAVSAAEKPLTKTVRKTKIKVGQGITGFVAKMGKPYLSNDVSKESRYLNFDKKTKSEACVPLKISDRLIGVINVESYKENAFDTSDMRILAMIANQAAVAIENSRLYRSLEDSYLDTIKTLVMAMEAKDHETRGHSERVRKYAIKVAEILKLDDTQVNVLNYAGYLHDIGKIGISDFILNKKEPLTAPEYNTIKKHPEIGYYMLKGVRHLSGASEIIRSEHEKYDGTGYPDGLKNERIPIGARIIAVADAYDAMTTDRPYRHALPKKEAVRRLKESAGTQFDPKVVKAFLETIGYEGK